MHGVFDFGNDPIQTLSGILTLLLRGLALRRKHPLFRFLNQTNIFFVCLLPDGIGHHLHRLVVGRIGNIIQQCLYVLHLQCQFFQLLLLRRQLFLLLHQDIVLLFQILPPTVGRLLIQMQPMPLRDVKQDRPADRIEGLFPVVVPAFWFIRVWERDAQFLQRLLLLGTQFPVAVLAVEHMALMDVGRPLVQVERPI